MKWKWNNGERSSGRLWPAQTSMGLLSVLINSPTVSGFELVTVNFVVAVPAEIDLFIIRC